MILGERLVNHIESSLLYLPLTIVFLLFSLSALFIVGIVGVESALILIILIGSAIWSAIVFVIMTIIRTMQLILLRIVDHPKGPILGLSGLLVGIAALAKAFL